MKRSLGKESTIYIILLQKQHCRIEQKNGESARKKKKS